MASRCCGISSASPAHDSLARLAHHPVPGVREVLAMPAFERVQVMARDTGLDSHAGMARARMIDCDWLHLSQMVEIRQVAVRQGER